MAVDWTWASPLPHAASATARLDKSLRHARKTIITCDRGRCRLALSCYKRGGAEPPLPISSSLARFFLLALLLTTMAPIRRFSAEEKGKAPRDDPGPLPPNKRSIYRRDEAAMQVVRRPWCERPPPGYPLPLYARAEGSGGWSDEQRRPRRVRGRCATATRAVAPRVHATDSSRELVLWAPTPPSS